MATILKEPLGEVRCMRLFQRGSVGVDENDPLYGIRRALHGQATPPGQGGPLLLLGFYLKQAKFMRHSPQCHLPQQEVRRLRGRTGRQR